MLNICVFSLLRKDLSTNNVLWLVMESNKHHLSFREIMPKTKLTKINKRTIDVSSFTKKRLKKYKRDNELTSMNHVANTLLNENEMFRSLLGKMEMAQRKAITSGNPQYFIKVLYDMLSNIEKAMYEMIVKGSLI